jgi:hypothetical protein
MGVVASGVHRLAATASWVQAKLSARAQLHAARFSHLHELSPLHSDMWPDEAGLLLCRSSFHQPLLVRPTPQRRELGNLLICAPPRSGKSQAGGHEPKAALIQEGQVGVEPAGCL